ncbi:hypothetical protein B566_EDAN010997 [Ephemera danica]|nr:hypothetical protein B566_EDAN010997 [Ephemera danica]
MLLRQEKIKMAIPFQYPTEDENTRLLLRLEYILFELFEVLQEIEPTSGTSNQTSGTQASNATTSATISAVGGPLSPTPLQNISFGFKTRTPTANPAATAGAPTSTAIQRQSWEQLGAELRQLADRFSEKDRQIGASGLTSRLLSLFVPKTLGYSAAIVFVGLKLLKSRFA